MTTKTPSPAQLRTPRTDDKVLHWNMSKREEREAWQTRDGLGEGGESINGRVVLADFARELERENTALRSALEAIIAECPDPKLPYGKRVVELARQALARSGERGE